MSAIQFQVQSKIFHTDLSFCIKNNQFKIQSIPRPYSVKWDEEPIPGKSILKVLSENPKNVLLIDEKVFGLYGSTLAPFPQEKIIKIRATEKMKTLEGALKIVDFIDQNQITKADKLVVVGGGIIQDIGSFAAAIFKRGIPWVFFPTTLLSQSDSCLGGKTSLNYKQGKNQLALVCPPSEVIINPYFLRTLTADDISSGLGEVLKLHITGGPKLLTNYQTYIEEGRNLSPAALKELILGALSVKKAIIEEDEFELDVRKSMNYGHTLGHAIEVLSDYVIPHGLAVVFGIVLVNELSYRRNLLQSRQKDLLKTLAFQLLTPATLQAMKNLDTDDLLNLLQKDKKTMGNKVNFIVIHSIGDMRFLSAPIDTALKQEITQIIGEVFH